MYVELFNTYNLLLLVLYKVTYTVTKREIDKVYARMSSGEESETPGLLEQWLREGKLSEEDAITTSISMFLAGVDTVSNKEKLVSMSYYIILS